MPRAPRRDTPGSWHHVMARGIAKRTIFECRDDFRYFLSLVARMVRRGLIEMHAYALLQTHFHLLVRSPCGRLSYAIAQVLREYSRWFNRRRGRDGALFKERYKSKPVEGDAYRSVLVRYIDDNAVKARLAAHAAAYPYGSAFHYGRVKGPRWLERAWIEEEVKGVRGSARYQPRDYSVRFPSKLPGVLGEWIEDRLLGKRDEAFADLVAPHEQSQVAWMVRKALLADGTQPFVLPLPPALVEEELSRMRAEEPGWPPDVSRQPGVLWATMRAGLLRGGCALSYAELRARVHEPESTIAARVRRHSELVRRSSEYVRRAALIIERVQRRLLREAHPHRYTAVDALL